jgi:T-complex protein 1 subunit beta
MLIYFSILILGCVHAAERFQSDLCKIAKTTLSSKVSAQGNEHFANLAVDAVLWLKVL